MASVLRKRKIIDGPFGSSPSQSSIAAFGRISKSTSARPGKKHSKIPQNPTAACPSQSLQEPQIQQKKRKLQHTPEAPVSKPLKDHPLNVSSKVSKPTKSKSVRSGPSASDTPLNERRIAPLKKSSKVTESPTSGARAILEAFVIATPPPPYKARASTQPETTPSSHPDFYLSTEFQDLLTLHAAFLSSLSLHYAHNGTSAPAILSELRPSIERTWGKRRIEAGDIQRLLAIQQLHPLAHSVPALSIVDFGRGKLGIEFSSNIDSTPYGSPLPSSTLRDTFTTNLHQLLKTTSGDATLLPLHPIIPFTPNQTQIVPSKGAQRLTDIRATAASAQAATAVSDGKAAAPQRASGGGQKAVSRGISLLERIKAKEEHKASLPAAPSSEQIERRAALMRLEEIIPVIESLTLKSSGGSMGVSGGGSRGMSAASGDLAAALGMGGGSRGSGLQTPATKTVSFTMKTLVQHLQMSLKHPVSAEEAERCVGLLAREVLPNWVQLREIGKMKSVSVRGSLGRKEWVGRLRELTDMA